MRMQYANAIGIRRGAGSPALAVGSPAVTETIDISTFSGNATFDVTTIGGVAVGDFTHIQFYLIDALRSSSGTHITMQLRQEGGAFADEAYRWMNTSPSTANISTGGSFNLTSSTSTTTFNGFMSLSSVNQPCPTGIRHCVTTTSQGVFKHGMTTDGAFVHDAIRFAAGSGTWTSGTLVITGYRCNVGTLYSGTFSGQTSVDITLANREYIADAFFVNVTVSSAAFMGVRPGVGGSYLSAGIYNHVLDAVAATGGNTFGMFAMNSDGTLASGRYAFASLYNLQTAAPFTVLAQDLGADGTDGNPQEIRGMVAPNATSYDQIRIIVGGSGPTADSGTYYIQTYKPQRTILLAQSLVSHGSPSVTKTGLKKNNSSLVVAASTDAARASSDSNVFVQVGDGSFATDYDQVRIDEATTSGPGAATVIGVTDDTAKTSGALMSILMGIPQATHTQQVMGMDMAGAGTTLQATMGIRETAEAEDRFQFRNGGGSPNWNAGTLYAVGYSL